MIPTPWAFSSPITRKRRSTSLSLSEAVGSSMIRIRASAPSARAISTSCCSGIDSVLHFRERVDRRADPLEQALRPRRRSRPAHAPPRAASLEPDRDVLGDRQVAEERRLLIDRGDAQVARGLGVEVRDRLVLDLDRARVGNMGAGDHLDQRRLARSVFADQGVNFARRRSNETRLRASTPANALLISVSLSNVDKTRFPPLKQS